MQWTALLAASDTDGGVRSMFDAQVEGETVEEAFENAKPLQDWNKGTGGFLLSRLTAVGHTWGDGPEFDRLVIHDNNDLSKFWLNT